MNENTESQPTAAESLKPLTGDHEATIERLEAELEKANETISNLETTIAELKDKSIRSLADQKNLMDRVAREQSTKLTYAISKFAKEMLDVVDVLQTGLDNCKDKDNEHYQGMDITLDKLLIILKQHDITPIDSKGERFDPNLHEALTSQESDSVESGMILHVAQEGYLFKDRVLRAAKVIVSKKVSKEA